VVTDAAFRRLKRRFDGRRPRIDGLVCKQGRFGRCPVLKLQKPAWTNDPMDEIRNETGIFFSIWSVPDAVPRNRVHYNIHALKLRQLKGYAITSRDFADGFRNRFVSIRDAWPHVSTEYGPLTLMQGWIESEIDRVEDDLFRLMEQFDDVIPVIDLLLARRRK
jgi:hypothetical protein